MSIQNKFILKISNKIHIFYILNDLTECFILFCNTYCRRKQVTVLTIIMDTYYYIS